MTAPRIALIAALLLLLSGDLVRLGSIEYAYRAEIARAEEEIAILERHRADLRAVTQRRLLARIVPSGVGEGEVLARLEMRRESTPWESSTGVASRLPRAFAIEAAETGGWRTIGEWLSTQDGAVPRR